VRGFGVQMEANELLFYVSVVLFSPILLTRMLDYLQNFLSKEGQAPVWLTLSSPTVILG
jgi:hypothetical protein